MFPHICRKKNMVTRIMIQLNDLITQHGFVFSHCLFFLTKYCNATIHIPLTGIIINEEDFRKQPAVSTIPSVLWAVPRNPQDQNKNDDFLNDTFGVFSSNWRFMSHTFFVNCGLETFLFNKVSYDFHITAKLQVENRTERHFMGSLTQSHATTYNTNNPFHERTKI